MTDSALALQRFGYGLRLGQTGPSGADQADYWLQQLR